jgi:hypothetical protein
MSSAAAINRYPEGYPATNPRLGLHTKPLFLLVTPTGFEPVTLRLGI